MTPPTVSLAARRMANRGRIEAGQPIRADLEATAGREFGEAFRAAVALETSDSELPRSMRPLVPAVARAKAKVTASGSSAAALIVRLDVAIAVSAAGAATLTNLAFPGHSFRIV